MILEHGITNVSLVVSDQGRVYVVRMGADDLVLAHNDLLPANILRGCDRLWLIVWERGAYKNYLSIRDAK